ncbi:MAG: NAD(P)/FAD-dependent oxidoreductase [Candidatus Omnitrophica bacterium]|nr:NAD(P)/FAD-dependent oxidoreductase [Candidatus Omnitrophota bacterium]
MKEVTVLGAGAAGLAFVNSFREKDSVSKIVLIEKNPYSFNRSDFISKFSLKNWLKLQDWVQGKNIELVCDSVERVNNKRRKIYFKQSQPKEFDILIVATGLTSRKISTKGGHREGFFYLSQIESFKARDLIKVSTEATVYVSTILGLRLALSLHSLGKVVRIVGKTLDFLGEFKEEVINYLKEKNIPVYLDTFIEEAIGEGTVKAAKISPLKVFSSQLVFIDSGFLPNRNFFEEEVYPRDIFFTGYEGVYFLGDVNREAVEDEFFFSVNSQEAKEQGCILADYVLEGKVPVFQRKSIELENRRKIIQDLLSE